MASTLTLDMKDPATAEMVNAWADNTEYTITMTVVTGAGNKRNVATVEGPIEETEPEPEVEEEAAVPAAEAGPAAVSAALSAGAGPTVA